MNKILPFGEEKKLRSKFNLHKGVRKESELRDGNLNYEIFRKSLGDLRVMGCWLRRKSWRAHIGQVCGWRFVLGFDCITPSPEKQLDWPLSWIGQLVDISCWFFCSYGIRRTLNLKGFYGGWILTSCFLLLPK